MTEPPPTIALVTALPKEFAAMRALVDDPWEENHAGQGAGRRFTRGTIPARGGGRHPVVLALLPDMGNNLATFVVTRIGGYYPTARNYIMVGIAGGVPQPSRPSEHVRLGDIVVSDRYGVVQYDLIKEGVSDLVHRAPPRPPSAELVEAVRFLQADEVVGERPWLQFTAALAEKGMGRPDEATDVLASTQDPSVAIPHPYDPDRQPGVPRVFFGPVASANVLLKNPVRRDSLRDTFGVKAVEMEGSGVSDASWAGATGYLVVRGICDYCDANKGDAWQQYAAAAAASYVRALLESMPADVAPVTHEAGVSVAEQRLQLAREVDALLSQNGEIYQRFGPESEAARANPLSDAARIWAERKRSVVIPNNLRIVELVEASEQILNPEERRIFSRFREHALVFAMTVDRRLDAEAVPRFPAEFREMIRRMLR